MSAADFTRMPVMGDEHPEHNPLFWHQFALVVAMMLLVAITVAAVRNSGDRDECNARARLQGATRGEFTMAGGCIGIKPDGTMFRPTKETP
jgi:hypothetical protein